MELSSGRIHHMHIDVMQSYTCINACDLNVPFSSDGVGELQSIMIIIQYLLIQ